MARHTKGPWFRESKNTWYATREGRKLSLGVRGKDNRPDAVAAWHRLMAMHADSAQIGRNDQPCDTRPTAPIPKPSPSPAPSPTVGELVEEFTADAATRLKSSTARRYADDLAVFARAVGTLPVAELTHKRITAWLASLTVSETTKSIMLRSVSAMLGWGVRNDIIPTNPAVKVAKPKSRSRGEEAVITEDENAKLLAATNPEFRIVLRVLHATGCRPGEACAITSDTFDPTNAVVKLHVHKTDKTGRPRLIFLPPDIVELLNGLLARYRSGPLLRSRVGVPYTPVAITRTMCRLKKRHGLRGYAYAYRHTFCNDSLAAGVPEAHVDALMGHTNTNMIHKHYGHLTSRADVLREAANKVRG